MNEWKQLSSSTDGRNVVAAFKSSDDVTVRLYLAREGDGWNLHRLEMKRENLDPTAAACIRSIPLEWLKTRALLSA